MNFGFPSLVLSDPESTQAALDGLVSDFGPEAGDWAVYATVSAWWRETQGVWGHQQASCVHSDASDQYRGRTSWLSEQPPEVQTQTWRDADRARVAWEQAGRPGLIEKADSIRAYILTLPKSQKGGAACPA